MMGSRELVQGLGRVVTLGLTQELDLSRAAEARSTLTMTTCNQKRLATPSNLARHPANHRLRLVEKDKTSASLLA